MIGSAHTYPVLGVPASIRVSGPALPAEAIDRIHERWAALESRFDLSRPDSELSLVAAGRSSVQRASREFRAAHADAMRWRTDTAGHFRPHRPDGVLDLDGLVKAYAIREAAAELAGAGVEAWMIELGGAVMSDALGAGGWTAGIPDPAAAEDLRLLTAVPLGGSWTAVATARSGDRDDHTDFVQASVLARDIVAAQALAASVASGGAAAFELAIARWPIDVLTVDQEGGLRSTPRLGRHVRESSERDQSSERNQISEGSVGAETRTRTIGRP